MNAPLHDHRVIHLHQQVIKALAKSTTRKPATQEAMRQLAASVVGGAAIVDQFLDQLTADKAISRSTGMKDGVSFASYWPTAKFDAVTSGINNPPARPFTPAEKGLIRKVHGLMPAQQLLEILNERLMSDLGPDAVPYQMEQLYAEIGGISGGAPAGGHDWPSLRKLLAAAKRSGVLDSITEQTINDFAVVFSLNQKQVLVLKDIILPAKEE